MPDEVRLDDDAIEETTSLKEWDVQQGRLIEPKQIGGDEADLLIWIEGPCRKRLLAQA